MIIEVTFDRIQLRSEWLGLDFDTREDDPLRAIASDSAAMDLIYKLRATKASQITTAVSSRAALLFPVMTN